VFVSSPACVSSRLDVCVGLRREKKRDWQTGKVLDAQRSRYFAANVTVNAPVKYAVEKRKLYVMDEDGKEHEMEIIKKTLRLPEGAK